MKTRLVRLISQIPARRWPGLLRLWLSAALVVGSVWSAAPLPVAHAATIIVSSTADSGPGSLRQALLDASNGDVINIVGAGVITLTSGELPITKTLTINGPGAASLTVSGNNVSRVLSIAAGVAVTLTGITIADGYVGASSDNGGGIYNAGALALVNSTVYNNTAAGGISMGGGIYNGGILTLTAATVLSNTATLQGGGIYNDASANDASASLVDSAVLSNTAEYDGGGIYNSADTYTLTVVLNNTVVRGNATTINGFGGGLASRGGSGSTLTVEITDSLIQGNTAGWRRLQL